MMWGKWSYTKDLHLFPLNTDHTDSLMFPITFYDVIGEHG